MFRDDFYWGAATASYQVEGAYNEDGKGFSVWDAFTHDGRSFNGDTGDVACDHYHRIEQDVKLMKEMRLKAYRFSISWTRILPNGIGEVNEKGVEFYNKLIDCLLENGITPFVTLFHWDYPYHLENLGGWRNDESSEWYLNYAKICFERFGDRVKNFITFNEPACFIGLGYKDGVHAPGYKLDSRSLIRMAHNVLLSHGKAVKAIREIRPDCKIGFAPNAGPIIPFTDSQEDIEAAKKGYFFANRDNWAGSVVWWSDPILLGRYPEETDAFRDLGQYLPESYKEDLKIISEPIDFYGQNIYSGIYCEAKENGGFRAVKVPSHYTYSTMKWPITPEALYWGPKFLYERYNKPIIITENGIACHDIVSSDGKVHDASRIEFLERYIKCLKDATNDGVDIRGYFCWSLMDNFEWAEGFWPRFGFIYVDYPNDCKRIPKDSYYWYKNLIEDNGKSL